MTKNDLGTVNGCFVPCLLTILGATLFLRLGFSIGMMGLAGGLGILLFSEWLSYTTVSSFSAIASNGKNGAGGAYFMISRCLGLPFGGASGFLFWVAYCMNASYNCAAFTSVFQSTFFDDDSWWRGGYWPTLIISSITMVPLGAVAFNGAGTFAQVNVIVFVGLAVGCIMTTYSLFFWGANFPLKGYPGATYSPFNLQTLEANMWPDPAPQAQCGGPCGLPYVFAEIFPAVVGMMEGLNLIGDLKDPVKSIPLGTYSAVSCALVVYVVFMVGQAGTLDRIALQYDLNVMQHATIGGGAYVVLGVVTATLSTVLGSMFGASRILQAMARDNVFPGLTPFQYGSEIGDEPQPAVLMSYVIAQAFLFIGDLDAIAPILTICFLLTYSLTDFSCFLLERFHQDDFKPTFKFYSWQTSLFNSILIIFVMFYLSISQAIAAILIGLMALWVATVQNRGKTVEYGEEKKALLKTAEKLEAGS
jgi:potassium/chloride transporter 9